MQNGFLNARLRFPITLPNGELFKNTVWLKSVIDHPNIEIGEFTYYNDFEPVEDYASRIAPYLHQGAPERLRIGKFGQFAHGTRFITSSANHPLNWFTSYPFGVFNAEVMPFFAEEFSQGADSSVGHDVWIGHGAMIMPGVTIGNGAIIGAGSVVTRDVPAYHIVAGNPARIIRARFTAEIIALLEALAWWDLPLEEIKALMPLLTSADEAALREALARYRA